jgi:hypothetical protein
MEIKRSLKNDLTFGLSKENSVMDKLKTVFGEGLKNTKDIYGNRYCVYDFETDDGISFELKSRRVTKHRYPTTLLPVHKVRNVETPQYFVFHFTDGITSYMRYDKELFDTFKTFMLIVYREGAPPTPQNHYEIPIELLTDI